MPFITIPEFTRIHVVCHEGVPRQAFLSQSKAEVEAAILESGFVASAPLDDFDVISREFWQALFDKFGDPGEDKDAKLAIHVVLDQGRRPVLAFISPDKAMSISARNTGFSCHQIPLEDFNFSSPEFYITLVGEAAEVQQLVSQVLGWVNTFGLFRAR